MSTRPSKARIDLSSRVITSPTLPGTRNQPSNSIVSRMDPPGLPRKSRMKALASASRVKLASRSRRKFVYRMSAQRGSYDPSLYFHQYLLMQFSSYPHTRACCHLLCPSHALRDAAQDGTHWQEPPLPASCALPDRGRFSLPDKRGRIRPSILCSPQA